MTEDNNEEEPDTKTFTPVTSTTAPTMTRATQVTTHLSTTNATTMMTTMTKAKYKAKKMKIQVAISKTASTLPPQTNNV